MHSTLYSSQILTEFEYSGQIFEKKNLKYIHRNLSGGSRVVPCGRTDMTKLIFAFRHCASAPRHQSRNVIN
jgi:uncharacterized HAD superfamily protein